MQKDAIYHTPTMAKVLADQGKLREAAEIYRHLIGINPEKIQYQDALAIVEARLQAQTGDRIQSALGRWMSFLLVQKQYHYLRRIRQDRVLKDHEG